MNESPILVNVEKIYDIEWVCPNCDQVATDKLINCMIAKCHCNHIVEFDEFDLDNF